MAWLDEGPSGRLLLHSATIREPLTDRLATRFQRGEMAVLLAPASQRNVSVPSNWSRAWA